MDVFPGVWTKVGSLVESGRLISHIQVFKEIEKGDDELVRWAKVHKRIFESVGTRQIEIVRDILTKFPSLVNHSKETADADPFLVALAIAKGKEQSQSFFQDRYVVVTEEKIKENKIGIPYVCNHYGIECCQLLELFRRENWKF
jgi:hypothetical protein